MRGLNLEKSVGSRFLAQAIDFRALQKNTCITEWVRLRFFKRNFKSIACAIGPRPTDLSRLKNIVIITAISLSCLSTDIYAEKLEVTLTDQSGNPVVDSVVSAYLQSQTGHAPIKSGKTVIIDQVDKEFINHVTPVQTGTKISFPNHDQIRHHVYSFSYAKNFEIPLYKGIPVDPITFDQAGVVVLGCNIHDQMSAYIVVVDSPYFAQTDGLSTTTIYADI